MAKSRNDGTSAERSRHNFDLRRKDNARRRAVAEAIRREGRAQMPNHIAPHKIKQVDEDYDLFSDGSWRRHRGVEG